MKNLLAPLLLLGLLASCRNTATTETATTSSTDSSTASVGQPKLLAILPEKYNTPDGLAISPDSSTIYLSVPNLANNTYPGVLLKIVNDSIQFVTDLPAHPDTKHACPMDLAFGPDGNLYYAENQYENDKNYKSRLMRIRMTNGQPGVIEPVVTNFGLSNAVVWKSNTIYVTDSQWDLPGNTNGSAIFRFTLDELTKGVIALVPKTMDPHLLTTFTTKVNETSVDNGADGMDYDSKGNLYTGLFGDGTIYKIALKPDGTFAGQSVLKVSEAISCVDGMIIDRKTDKIYVCDSRNNAIKIVAPDGKVSVLAQNGDTDGTGGLLDQPAEVLLKGNRLYISDFDKPEKKFVNTKSDAPRTMSYIDITR